MNAIATGTGRNSVALIAPANSTPSTAAGRKATTTLVAKRRARGSARTPAIVSAIRVR